MHLCSHALSRFGRYVLWPHNSFPRGHITATCEGIKLMLVWGVDRWPWCANRVPSGKSILFSRSCFTVLSDYISRVDESSNPMLLVMCEHSLWITFQNKVWRGYLGKAESCSEKGKVFLKCTMTQKTPLMPWGITLLRLLSVCRCVSKVALLTPCSEILSCSYFRSILAHWIRGFYCLRRGQYFSLTI